MRFSISKAAATAAAICCPLMAHAEEITLKTPEGETVLKGDLIEYQDNVYVVDSPLGSIRVLADKVECFGSGCPDTEVLDNEVTFSGSDTIAAGLMPILLAGYAAKFDAEQRVTETIGSVETNTQFISEQGFGDLINSFRVRSSISSDAFANLLGQSAEIGVSSRRITVEEARALKEFGSGSMVSAENEHILANDSIIVITHPSNPIKSLTMTQLAEIYGGSISNWSEVGGANAPINVVHLKRGAGTRSIFEARVMENVSGAPINVVEAESSVDVSRQVIEDENSIGYISFAFNRGAKPLTLVNECGIAIEPDEFSAKTGEYFLQRPLYFYTRQDTLTDEAKDFLNWSKSADADLVILKSGFIDLGVSRVEQAADGTRASNLLNANLDPYETQFANEMISQMVGYDRLSSTFRFRAGSNRLTPQSRVGMERLINYLSEQPESEVMLVGFTDNQGPFDANMNLAKDRAEVMVQEIASQASGRLDHITFSTTGYGELAPVACNASKSGQSINRRIEVWIKNARS